MQTRPPSGPSRTPPAQRRDGSRAAQREREQAAARQRRLVLIAGGVILAVVAALVVIKLATTGNGTTASANQPAPPDVVAAVAGVDPATFEQVGRGSVTNLLTPVRGTLERGPDGKPRVTYIGAEYCPFCAGERWALVAALSRFGTFSDLQLSHSASEDVYPNTPTFSFVGSSYSSPYVDFSPVELQSNVRSGNGYQTLQTPTTEQRNVLQTYDVPPYVPAQSAGAIPFIDIGGQYALSGASYDISALRGMSAEQIAAALSDPSSQAAKGILGSANVLTAAICSATDNQPADVCASPTIQMLQSQMAAAPVPSK